MCFDSTDQENPLWIRGSSLGWVISLSFAGTHSTFIERMKQKHGDVFTVQLGGSYITFIQDPLSFGVILKESRENFGLQTVYSRNVLHRVFGYVGLRRINTLYSPGSPTTSTSRGTA